MKILSLLMWVTQFGLSGLFPICFFLLLAVWLKQKFSLGMWIIIVFGILGVLITISTVRANWKAMRKAANEAAGSEPPPMAFNDHK